MADCCHQQNKYLKKMRNSIKFYSGWIVAAVLILICVKQYYENIKLKEDCAINRKMVSSVIPKINQAISAIKSEQSKSDTGFHQQDHHDTLKGKPELTAKLDTVQKALTKSVNDQVSIETKSLRDSLFQIKGQLLASRVIAMNERLSRLNLVVSTVDPESPKYAEKSRNANVNLYEFQKKKYPSIFSPERSYLRVTNIMDSGTVNGMPYLDYELRNDNIYQLMFQARTGYSPISNRHTVGIGAELKLNNVSINAVMNYDQSSKRRFFNPSFGLRYDFARIVLK